jgi:hypothetical protein
MGIFLDQNEIQTVLRSNPPTGLPKNQFLERNVNKQAAQLPDPTKNLSRRQVWRKKSPSKPISPVISTPG